MEDGRKGMRLGVLWVVAGLFLWCAEAADGLAQGALNPAERARVDEAVRAIMQRNDVPGLSLAVVRGGQIAYVQAYGAAVLPDRAGGAGRAADVSTRFAIGSVTKEFTAAAILLLAVRGRLSLDDRVVKFLPELTGAGQVTIRELLTHTSGYRDYFLQEYIPARMQRPTSVDAILRGWGQRPLDFPPGSQWQYSGTNYVIAGRIVEKVTGEPYARFLQENVLRPVGIVDATYADHADGQERNAVGYYRFALGPARVAPRTGRNWLFAMADLEMTATDLARWDISVMKQSLLSAGAYREMGAEAKTSSGRATGYGLGFFVRSVAGVDGRQHVLLHHPGEISGFRSHNFVLPDLKAAVVILTNAEYSDTTDELASRLQGLVGVMDGGPRSDRVAVSTPEDSVTKEDPIAARAHRLAAGLALGQLHREHLAPDALASFSPQAMRDLRASLAPLGELQSVRVDSAQVRGGTKHYALTLVYPHRELQVAEYDLEDGRIEQFMIDSKP
jgi:D-alanyl-D-alanine carboxypeptidase